LVLVTFLFALVSAHQHFKFIIFEESCGDVGPKLSADTALAGRATNLILGVTPQHLAHDSALWGLAATIRFLDISERNAVLAKQTAMAHHHCFVDHHAQGQLAEHLREQFVLFFGVLGGHFAEEAIHSIKRGGLVIASRHIQVLGQANLPHDQRQNHLN